MPGVFFNDMELLSERDVERVYRVTDDLQLHRDWVIVPLMCSPEGVILQMPDGKILLRPPGADRFERWLEELPSRLKELKLGRVPRPWHQDPNFDLTGPGCVRLGGTRRHLAAAEERRPSKVDTKLRPFEMSIPSRKAG